MNSLKSEESKLEQNLRLVIWALLKQRLEMEREFITVQTFRVFSFIFFAKLNSLPKSLTVERAWRRRKIQKEKFQKTRTQRNNTRTHVVYFDQPKAAPQTISWLKSTISVILYFFRQMQGKTKKKLVFWRFYLSRLVSTKEYHLNAGKHPENGCFTLPLSVMLLVLWYSLLRLRPVEAPINGPHYCNAEVRPNWFGIVYYISVWIVGVWSVGPKPAGQKTKNEKAEILKMGVFRANLT